MSHLIVAGLALLVLLVGCSQAVRLEPVANVPTVPSPATIVLGAAELHGGLEARRTLVRGDAIVLDTRNWQVGELPGRLTTDVIDLGGETVVSVPMKIAGLTVRTAAQSPAGSKVLTLLRHGPDCFQAGGWTDWRAVEPGKPVDLGPDRYVQLRLELHSDSAKVAPAVSSVMLQFTRQGTTLFQSPLSVADRRIQHIVRSTIQFGYERMDQADLAWLRKSCNLDAVIAGRKSELDRLIALNDWASKRRNVRGDEATRHMGSRDPYPWNIRRIFGLENGGTVYGHCASYSQLLITAACALGWHARHINNEGYRENTHEVAEIWVNELGKWVYFDPSLGTYYTDRQGNPLGILEMHDIFVDFFVEPGKTLKGYLPRVDPPDNTDKGYRRWKKLDFSQFPAVCVTNDYTYGEHKPWDWTIAQGIMTAGFLQMTPRNNFNGQPQPVFTRYGYSPEGVNGFPYWADAKTPLWYDQADGQPHPDGLTRNWFTRPRDWNWTLNQASARLIRTGENEITVELGNSQPFFRKYLVTINGDEQQVTNATVTWKLVPGRNTLTVNCVDEFGQKGIPSSMTVLLGN